MVSNLTEEMQILKNLECYTVLLASKSPRRRELLSGLGISFRVVSPGDVKEEYPDTLPAEEVPEYLGRLKADAYMPLLQPGELLITADTLVICDGKIFGKPADADDAVRMLMNLSGHTHTVVSGVCLTTTERRASFSSRTQVKFAAFTEAEARYYVDNYNPLDKAGAYGIQEWMGYVACQSIDGSFYNVMGLPVNRLYEELKKF